MAKSLNRCTFIGYLGQDPETKYLPSGKAVTNISIAVADGYKDKQSGQQVDRTEWVRCVAFDRLAEIMSEYLRKGSKVYIEGKFTTRKWQDQSGQDRYSTEIVVNDMQMLDSRDNSAPQQQAPQPRQQAPGQTQQSPGFDDFDDDIPF